MPREKIEERLIAEGYDISDVRSAVDDALSGSEEQDWRDKVRESETPSMLNESSIYTDALKAGVFLLTGGWMFLKLIGGGFGLIDIIVFGGIAATAMKGQLMGAGLTLGLLYLGLQVLLLGLAALT